MAAEDNNEQVLKDIDKEQQKAVNVFLSLMMLEFVSMTSLLDYINITNSINIDFQRFSITYSNEIKRIMTEEITRINPLASPFRVQELINDAFIKKYNVKGSTSKVNLNDIIFRRAEKMKNDLYLEINARGYDQLSKSEIDRIKKKVLSVNEKGIAQISSNEVHKIQNQASIDRVRTQGVEPRVPIFIYRTQGDDRVRSSHAAHAGDRLTASEAQELQGSIMSEVNCRCFFEPI